jgi:hypothetical protein
MIAVPITPGDAFSFGKPQALFDLSQYGAPATRPFDVAPDGRFVMVKFATTASEASARPRFVVVSNWFDELGARMAASR